MLQVDEGEPAHGVSHTERSNITVAIFYNGYTDGCAASGNPILACLASRMTWISPCIAKELMAAQTPLR